MGKEGYFFGSRDRDALLREQNEDHHEALIRRVGDDVKAGYLPEYANVLDVGCSMGALLERFRTTYPRYVRSIAGVEPMDGARAEAQELHPDGIFYDDIARIPDRSTDIVLSHETLYCIKDLAGWLRDVKRVLRGKKSGAFLSLGCHGENEAWMRWIPALKKQYGHDATIHMPMKIVETASKLGFHVRHGYLHKQPQREMRYSPPSRGYGDFASQREAISFADKSLFILYPKR